jgi:hypothetical protein
VLLAVVGTTSVRLKSCTTSAFSMPQAEKADGAWGTTTGPICISRPSRGTAMGPAPPNASTEKSRGSSPFSTVISRMAPTIFPTVTS